jgi:large subunit ribosomal protein L15
MPLQRRIPKRGFTNIFATRYAIVNVKDLNVFNDGTEVTPELLKEAGIVKAMHDGVKVLGDGVLERKLTLKVHKVSRQAEEKVTAVGGRVEVI